MVVFGVVTVEERLDESPEVGLQTVELTPVQGTYKTGLSRLVIGKLCRVSICFLDSKTTEMSVKEQVGF